MEEVLEVQEGGSTLHQPYFQMVGLKTFCLNENVSERPLRGQPLALDGFARIMYV